jgi:adenylate cyclase
MADPTEFDWKVVLDGTDPRFRRFRNVLRRIPNAPRCKMCYAPFAGPGAPFMRAMGRRRWAKNPNYCGACIAWLGERRGGAEIELSFLFADVRGSTALGERLSPTEFSELLNRFYEAASRVVIDHEGLVDKFVGDEIVAFFPPGFVGPEHAAVAVDAAQAILEATGHGAAGDPWVPVGAGVHSGIAFVGSVGEGGVTDFTALGDAVNTTARLASAAGAGEILVSRAAATAAGISTEDLEERHLELRGRTEPVDVLVLHAAASRAAAPLGR